MEKKEICKNCVHFKWQHLYCSEHERNTWEDHTCEGFEPVYSKEKIGKDDVASFESIFGKKE